MPLTIREAGSKDAEPIASIHVRAWQAAYRGQLDDALRKALTNDYPELEHIELEDYRVRVLAETHGTGAVVRVLIDTSDGEREWTTVGVSENIIEASWEALTESYLFGLVHRLGVGLAGDANARWGHAPSAASRWISPYR